MHKVTVNAQSKLAMPQEMREEGVKRRGGKLHKGDVVEHTAFGEGVIVSIKDGLATIAFDHKFGIRKIMADHPSLRKK